MEAEDLRRWMRSTGVDLWALIDTAISVAAGEHRQELRSRRDGIVQRLYAAGDAGRCRNCGSSGGGSVVPRREEAKGSSSSAEKRAAVGAASPPSPESMNRTAAAAAAAEEEEEEDDQRTYGRSIDEEQSKILGIKQFLDDPDQNTKRRFEAAGYLSSERTSSESVEPKAKSAINPTKTNSTSTHAPSSASPAVKNPPSFFPFSFSVKTLPKFSSLIYVSPYQHKAKEHKDNLLDPERLASARKRLHENYQEAQNGNFFVLPYIVS
ncbi:hypothetical protein B296_00029404 [Ensete ventricosum]|uniref:Uncharacterized protein n=1 Tax=Ensete ventricosum TaxID=4639 RepID=A0A426XGE1_ENSVE|nr:hypothetical protein B296_00029404 [Ensete ventricosum]